MTEHEHRHEAAEHEHAEHDHAEHDHAEHEHHHHHHEPIDYGDAVVQLRAQKDDYFATNPRSPIPEAERGTFTGLPYYAVDETLRFEGRPLEPYTGGEPSDFQIPTSDGKLRPAHRAGVLTFDLGAERRSLTAYTFDGGDEESLFVPFLDATSGRETYGAGRYLDIDPDEDGTYTIDFNLAYHPSCVYDPRYSCPLTPAENRLPVRIEAGERLAS